MFVSFEGDAATVRQQMKEFLFIDVVAAVDTSTPTNVVGFQPVVAADPSVATPPTDEAPKRGRGRPKKEVVETVEEAPKAVEPPPAPAAAEDEYEDVEPPPAKKPGTVADLRAACMAAIDRVSMDEVKEVLMVNYSCVVAADVPADKLDEAIALVSKLGT